MDYIKFNSRFWNEQSRKKGPWSRPVSKDLLEKAKSNPVKIPFFPEDLLPESYGGLDVLGLTCAGGQQMPLIAARGGNVTSYDFSREQLKKDAETCAAAGLKIKTERGEMEDLSIFREGSFDFVLNGVSVCYTKNVRKVWKEVFRTLRRKGIFITAFVNPCYYSLDRSVYEEKAEMKMIHKLPWSGLDCLSDSEREAVKEGEEGIEFSHSLSDLIGGQAEAGFKITALREWYWRDLGEEFDCPIDSIMPSFIFTKAVK